MVNGGPGEFDLLFQVRSDLKTEAIARLREIIAEKVPGSTVKTGISIAGKTAVYVGLAPKYRVKEVYSSLSYYFRDIPGTGGFSLMTEPRVTLAALARRSPRTVHPGSRADPRRAVCLPGRVKYCRSAGGRGEHEASNRSASRSCCKITVFWRSGSRRLPGGESSCGWKELAGRLAGQGGVTLVRDVTSGQSSDQQQALLLTMSEMKKFLLSYAGQVKIVPQRGRELEPGDLLVLDGQEGRSLKPGAAVKDEDVLIKVTSGEKDGEMQGLIVQGDAGFLSTALPARLLAENKKDRRGRRERDY